MSRLICGFAGRTYHIVGKLMSRLIYYSGFNGGMENSVDLISWSLLRQKPADQGLHCSQNKIYLDAAG